MSGERRAGAADVPAAGKRTLTEGISAGYTEIDAIAFFERSIGEGRAQLAALASAVVSGDRLAAVTAAGSLRRSLRSARDHLGHLLAAPGSRERHERLERLAELERLASSPLSIAALGVAGPGGALPFAPELQASFGRHDLSRVRAHTDGAAGDAARALGARAYALGDDLAFDGAPSLALAAHEAAHAVQQRAGVARKGVLDEPGDEYEQHADAVADAVVRGESAESLLDEMAGRGAGAAASPAVQRSARGATRSARPGPETPLYVEQNAAPILAALADRVTRAGVPEPHARLRWKAPGRAAAAIAGAIRSYVASAPGLALKRLMELSQPADLFAMVDDLRRRPGWVAWRPEIGAAIAAAFDEPITASVQRMGIRVRARMDTQTDLPSAESLVASCPLDRVVGELLVDPSLVVVGAKPRRGDPDDTPGHTFEHGPRHVTYEWQGERDPALWNWIRVTSPADATVEEVAQIPFLGGDVIDSEQAYRIAASPPYFGIPFETAKHVPKARVHAPFDLERRLQLGDPGPRYADRAVLARSAASDDAALAQAPRPTRGDPPIDRAIDRARLQLAFLQERLAPRQAARPLAAAHRFIERRRAELAADRRKAERWTAAIAAQERILHDASSEVAEVLSELDAPGAAPSVAAAPGPVVRVLEAYARAAGVSHLQAEAPAALEAARRLRALLPLAMAEDKLRVAREAVAAQQRAQLAAGGVDPRARLTLASVPELAARGADLRLAATRGGAPDAEAIEELAADADLTSLRAQILTLRTQLRMVEHHATAAGVPDARYRHGLPTLRAFPAALRKESDGWLAHLDDQRVTFGPGEGSERKRRTERKRRVMADVATQLAAYQELAGIGMPDGYFEWARQAIEDQLWRDLIAGIAVQVAILLATAQVASAGIAVLRGIAVGAEVVSGIRAAGTIFKAAEVVTQAGLATGVQGMMGGKAGRRELAENTLAGVLGHAAMRPFRGLLQQTGALEQEVHGLARAALRGGRLASELALESGAGIAAGAIARMAVHGGRISISGTDEWISQAISFAAGRFVHQRVQRLRARLELAKQQRREASEALDAAMKQAEALEKQTAAARQPTAEDARSFLEQYRRLLELERPLHPARLGNRLWAENTADRSAFGPQAAELPLHLAKLSPIVAGEIYEGSPAQIKQAFATAKALGITLEPTYDAAAGLWRVRAGARTITIRETGGRREDAHSKQSPTTTKASQGAQETGSKNANLKAGANEFTTTKRADSSAGARSAKRIEVPIWKLKVTERLTDKEWMFSIEAPLPNGRDQIIAYGSVMLDATKRPLGGPQFVFDKRVTINSEEHRISIQGGSGNSISLTDYSLDQAIKQFKTRFTHSPDELPGSLIDDNKLNFQAEYLNALDRGIPAGDAHLRAAKKISFGRSRIERGYTEFSVEVQGETTIPHGNPPKPRKVPAEIHITARRK